MNALLSQSSLSWSVRLQSNNLELYPSRAAEGEAGGKLPQDLKVQRNSYLAMLYGLGVS